MGDKFEKALKKSRNLRAWRNFEPEQALEIVDLVVHLKEIGYDCVGTIRQNRLSGCEVMEEKGMKCLRMGNIDWRIEKLTEVCLVRWYDSKVVMLVSNYVAV
ncbi:hypothetical protein QYM36_006626 [Artemia franciscana]|uniref:PiggyBac transposable element-derived protein domain-containing protein n=1 Tax=Artemia franciscana TaxID=6661 RepID=A0AA88HZ47_ARTSF|nr:hypothetical protein QYM36_006626 [Artemia franciscana]